MNQADEILAMKGSSEMEQNEASPCQQIGTELTQRRSGSDLVLGGFDLIAARRFIINQRFMFGADTPIGHRCSNMVEQLESYVTADSDYQRDNLKKLIVRSVDSIGELMGRRQIAAPSRALVYQPRSVT